MAIATQAGCEQLIGASRLQALLGEVSDPTEPDIAAYNAARLATALLQADSWLASYFPASFDLAGSAILARYACEHALYLLESQTENGCSDACLTRLEIREKLIWQMSQRKVFVDGSPEGRRGATRTVAVCSGSPYSYDRMRSL